MPVVLPRGTRFAAWSSCGEPPATGMIVARLGSRPPASRESDQSKGRDSRYGLPPWQRAGKHTLGSMVRERFSQDHMTSCMTDGYAHTWPQDVTNKRAPSRFGTHSTCSGVTNSAAGAVCGPKGGIHAQILRIMLKMLILLTIPIMPSWDHAS